MPTSKKRIGEKKRRTRNILAIAAAATVSFIAVGVLVGWAVLENARDEVSILILYDQFDAYFEAEKYVEAVIVADEMIARNPHNATSYTNRGLAKSMLGRHHEAIIDYSKAIELQPTPSFHENILIASYFNRGISYGEWGKGDEARADWTHALKLAKEEGDQAWISRLEEALSSPWPNTESAPPP